MIINKFFYFIFFPFPLCLIFAFFIFDFGSFLFTLLFLHLVKVVNVVWEIAKLMHLEVFVDPLSPFIFHFGLDNILLCSLNVLFNVDFFLFKLFFIFLLNFFDFLSLLLSFACDLLINLTLLNAQKFEFLFPNFRQFSPREESSPIFLKNYCSVVFLIFDLRRSLFVRFVPEFHDFQSPNNALPSSLQLLNDTDECLEICFKSYGIIKDLHFLRNLEFFN